VSVIPKGKPSDIIFTNVKSTYFDQGNQFYLQSNVTIPKDGFIITQIRDYSRNHACLSTINWILLIIILIINI
jgi:hypothetical protein